MQKGLPVAIQDSLSVDFFLVVHDPFDGGRLTVSPEVLGCGLVGGKLADLVFDRRLRVDDDRLVALDGPAPADEIDDYVVRAVRSQRTPHPVRSWIEPLQDELYEMIADRVVALGILQREQGQRRLGRGRLPDRFPAVDLLTANGSQQRLEQMLRSPRNLTLRAGMLAALLKVLGVDGVIAIDLDRTTVRDIITEIEDNLPTDLRAVYDGVRTVTSQFALRMR
jgi:Golgi phosphoprotein 3 GPP34